MPTDKPAPTQEAKDIRPPPKLRHPDQVARAIIPRHRAAPLGYSATFSPVRQERYTASTTSSAW